MRFPESWSSTSLGKQTVPKTPQDIFVLDTAFTLIEGHPHVGDPPSYRPLPASFIGPSSEVAASRATPLPQDDSEKQRQLRTMTGGNWHGGGRASRSRSKATSTATDRSVRPTRAAAKATSRTPLGLFPRRFGGFSQNCFSAVTLGQEPWTRSPTVLFPLM